MNKNSLLSIKKLCKIAQVSESGFYSWKNRKESNSDIQIINLIKEIYWNNKGKFGYRRITMELRRKYELNINSKKVLRIMQNNGLKAIIRKNGCMKKHRLAQRKNEKWTIAPNILNSNFKVFEPNKIYSTDVTYLKLKTGVTYYFSALKDLSTSEIIGYSVSNKHDVKLILNTIKNLKPNNDAIIHSDRGGLYTSFQYIQKLKELNITRSMSEAGSPTQNAPIESFFGHLKDEVDYKSCKNFEELKDKIDKYVYYYNTRRYQWKKNMLAPIEIREYLNSYKNTPI